MLSSSAWPQPDYGSMLIRKFYSPRLFGKPFCGPGLSSAPLSLPPGRHNHTCLILSNPSFILANQLLRCAPFRHLLSCDSIIFSLTTHRISPLSPSISCSVFPCHGIRVNLDPSKRQGSNKSVSGCTLPQGSKTVSKLPRLSLPSCLPVPPHLSASSCGN